MWHNCNFNMNKTKKYIPTIAFGILVILIGIYVINPNRWQTQHMLIKKSKQTSSDYMLSSLNVTAFAQDSKKLMWIGTSAGINVYNGQDYIQFLHDPQDTTALPDDYINVLHRDRQGRIWVGTQNGLAKYEGGYRFHRFALPTNNDNILSILDNKNGKDVVVSNGKEWFEINGDKIKKVNKPQTLENEKSNYPACRNQDSSSQPLTNLQEKALNKPKALISTTYKDEGGNLWIGFHNAGYQVMSDNVLAYKHANDNPLAEATKGKDITNLLAVGNYILAGTTLRLYVYETQKGEPKDYLYQDLFHGNKPSLNNMVSFDKDQVWLVGNNQILSCRLAPGNNISTSGTYKSTALLGYGTRLKDELYVSCQAPYLIKYKFGKNQAVTIPYQSEWYDNETQLTTLQDGNILLFMRNMHLALLSPSTQKLTNISISNTPRQSNIDPAFVRQDERGDIRLGTKRSGLYRFNLKEKKLERMKFVNDVHIQGWLEDYHHQIWITTLKDAICYQPATGAVLMNSLVSSSQNEWMRQYFDNSLCISPTGNIIFGSSDGCIFLPQEAGDKYLIANKRSQGSHGATYDQSRALENGLTIYTMDIRTKDENNLVLNDDIHDGDHYTLAYDENNIDLSFFYPNYSHRSTLMYQYKLEGYDKDWREPSYEHTAHFDNLAPGKYIFRLRLVSSPSLPSLAERNIEITIQPAPWFSAAAWWMYFCCLIAFIYYLNSLYLRIRSNHLQLVQEQHEREREQRTNEMNMSFFANISHEFRNPITIIAGPLLSLKQDPSLPASVQQTLDRVCMSVNRMLRLIDQMLDFNQLETDALRLKVAHVDAKQELQQLISTFEVSTRVRGIQLKCHFEESNYAAWLDTDKLEKVMSNLFTNALKHTLNNGIIRISTSCKEGKLQVSIFNNGELIAENKLQDVFKRYYQLADTQSSHHYGWGTGIGLYYVKRLIGLHYGEITVRNVMPKIQDTDEETTQGVEFSFWLPINKETYKLEELVEQKTGVMQIPVSDKNLAGKWEEQDIMHENTETEQSNVTNTLSETNKTKVLVVDDDIDVAQYIRSILANDYIVENRYSAEEALADLETVKPDIILSDIIMGKMSGYDFCKMVKQNLLFSHIPVILITAKSNMNEQIAGLRLGAVAYITKPFDPIYLKAMVETQLQNMRTLRQRLGESTETDKLSASVADTLSEQDRKFMDELYALMEKRSAEMELNVATICRDLLISQSKFNYKLKELTGETPGSFFRRYKLNKAAEWLKEGKYPISEVAVMTGFSTAAHFSVAFKKQFGVSPSEFTSSSH